MTKTRVRTKDIVYKDSIFTLNNRNSLYLSTKRLNFGYNAIVIVGNLKKENETGDSSGDSDNDDRGNQGKNLLFASCILTD